MATTPSINGQRLLRRIEAFAAIGATPAGGVDRQALTALDRQARAALASIAIERGFAVSQDPIANLFIRRNGSNAALPPFMIGSHLDTQPTGGRFDGALGVLAALEVLEAIEDACLETDAPIELVAWTNEEGCRFAPGSMGSQAFVSGAIPAAVLDAVSSTDGAPLAAELEATLNALSEATLRSLGGPLSGYLELHIEQGPILEREGVPIGIVSAVQGTRWLKVRISGQAGHAGTTPFDARRDPMMAAASGLSSLYATIMPGDPDARMTVGRISAEPGSINAIPSAVVFTIDIRHPSLQHLEAIEARISTTLGDAVGACGCSVGIDRIFDMPPAEFAEPLLMAIEQTAAEHGIRHRRIVSGAFHDALFISRIVPAAMIFVPCRDGVSHNENEFVEPEFQILGTEILLKATLRAINALSEPARPTNGAAAGVAALNA